MSDDDIAQANTNVLYPIANKLFPAPWSYLAVLSTILSTIGTMETQILQFSRSMYAMARDEMLHPRYSRIHPEWQTPWVAAASWSVSFPCCWAAGGKPAVRRAEAARRRAQYPRRGSARRRPVIWPVRSG
ncbi:MAG TPA: hypothetical protein VK165_13040 [Azonexus sp.]|nr:hypothetical protein [Azonexus sp.]